MKKITIGFFTVLFLFVVVGNIIVHNQPKTNGLPAIIRSNYFITLPSETKTQLNVVMYDKGTSKFSFQENYADISFETENQRISVGLPEKIESYPVTYNEQKLQAISMVVNAPSTNVDMANCSIIITLKDNSEYKLPYGNLVFQETDLAYQYNDIELLGKQSIVNNDTLIPEAAGFALYLKVNHTVVLKNFEFKFNDYGVQTDKIRYQKLTDSSEQIIPEMKIEKYLTKNIEYNLNNICFTSGEYCLYIPFSTNTEIPNTIWQLGGRLSYESENKMKSIDINGMTFMNINYADSKVLEGVLNYE